MTCTHEVKVLTTNSTLGMLAFCGSAVNIIFASFSNCFRACFFKAAAVTELNTTVIKFPWQPHPSGLGSLFRTHVHVNVRDILLVLTLYVKIIQQTVQRFPFRFLSYRSELFLGRRTGWACLFLARVPGSSWHRVCVPVQFEKVPPTVSSFN